jgi:hypothetical protein
MSRVTQTTSNWDSFSVFIKERHIAYLRDILLATVYIGREILGDA